MSSHEITILPKDFDTTCFITFQIVQVCEETDDSHRPYVGIYQELSNQYIYNDKMTPTDIFNSFREQIDAYFKENEQLQELFSIGRNRLLKDLVAI